MDAKGPAVACQARPGATGDRGSELLVQAGRGDTGAFEELYTLLAGPVFAMALALVRDPAQAEEVAQDALLDLWRTAPRYNPAQARALTWAMTLAHRRAVDRIRWAQHARDLEARFARPSPPYDQVTDQAHTRLDQQEVRACLAGLSVLQREAIVLVYYAGHSHPEVARLLGIPLGTVKSRVRDGLRRLRDNLPR